MKESIRSGDDVKATLHTEALKLANELNTNPDIDETIDWAYKAQEMIRKLVAELDKQGEPVVWMDKGIWSVNVEKGKMFLESSDFSHDVRLYIDGDFINLDQRLAYASELKQRLNTTPQTKPLSDKDAMYILERIDFNYDEIDISYDYEMRIVRAIEKAHGII